MVDNCKYKGVGLCKIEQGMYDILYPKTQLTKISLGSNGQPTTKWGPIKFVKACNLVELSADIDEDIWIDHSLHLAFDYFSTDDNLLEYLGAHSKFSKSNEKC